MTAMKLSDWFGINVACLGVHQDALLELRLKNALQRDKEGSAVVAVPVRIATRSDLRIIDLDFDLRVAGNGSEQFVEENISI